MSPKKKWDCVSCSAVFSCSAALSRHKRSHSEEEPKFQCAGCNRRFCRKDNFEWHQASCLKKKNKEETAFACHKCSKLFTTKYNLLLMLTFKIRYYHFSLFPFYND